MKYKILLIGLVLLMMLSLLPIVSADSPLIQSKTNGTTAVTFRFDTSTSSEATNITGNATTTISRIEVNLYKSGTPTGNVWLDFVNVNSTGLPSNTIIASSNNVSVATLTTTNTDYVNFTFTNLNITNTGNYSIVLRSNNTIDGANFMLVRYGGQLGYGVFIKSGGGTWTTHATNNQINYRMFGAPITNATFTAYNYYTNSTINSFCVNITGNYTCTTTGQVNVTTILTNSSQLWTVQYLSNESGGYFNETYTSVNVSTNVNKAMAQSVYTFSTTQKVSNATITGVNFTSVYLTNTTHYMSNGTFDINATKSGYFTKSQSVTAVALANSSFIIENMTDTRLNLTVRNAITNATVTTYTAQFNNSAYSYSQSNSTTNGTIIIDAITGNWTVYVDASGYALTLSNVTLSAGYNNITVYVYTSESINFFFYDEQSGNLINTTTVTLELIGSIASYNRTTTNGTLYIDLITPDDYTVRYYANGYTPRFSYITISNRTTQNISLYLLASVNGTNITVYVLRQDGSQVQGALVKLLKYDLATNSYIIREQTLTDYQGLTFVDVQFNAEFYKFLVEYPIGTVALTTDPAYITSTEITLILDSTLAGTFYNYIQGAGGDVSFNTGTNTFRFTWSDTYGVVTNSCLYVYRLESNYTGTYLGVNCSTASAGTLLYGVSNATQSQYYATGYFTIAGNDYFVDEAFADLRNTNVWGLLGVLLALGLTVTIVCMFLAVSPQASILSSPIGITITNFAGITQFSAWVPIGIFAIAVVIVFAMGRSK